MSYKRYRYFCNNLLKKVKINMKDINYFKLKIILSNFGKVLQQSQTQIDNISSSCGIPQELLSRGRTSSINTINSFFASVGAAFAKKNLNTNR